MQSVLAYWLHLRWGFDAAALGGVFLAANLLAGVSALAAGWLARQIGLLNTMVFTHLPSNVLLILVPLMPSAEWAIAVLLMRFSISQMDVPTRQAYTMAVRRLGNYGGGAVHRRRAVAGHRDTPARRAGALEYAAVPGGRHQDRLRLATMALVRRRFFPRAGLGPTKLIGICFALPGSSTKAQCCPHALGEEIHHAERDGCTAINSRRTWPHKDQMRQVAVECRNPTKVDFQHLLRPEGTSGRRPGSMTRHSQPRPSIFFTRPVTRLKSHEVTRVNQVTAGTGSSLTSSSVETLPFFMNTANG
jgi:hypothetical protein